MATTLVPDETVRIKMAGIEARPALRDLADKARRWPQSYSRERVMEEADAILDAALDKASRALAQADCIVCDGEGGGRCEFCKG